MELLQSPIFAIDINTPKEVWTLIWTICRGSCVKECYDRGFKDTRKYLQRRKPEKLSKSSII